MSATALWLVCSVGKYTVGGYTADRRRSRIHQGKVGVDDVGNRILQWRRRVISGGLRWGPTDRKAAWGDAVKGSWVVACRRIALANGKNSGEEDFDKFAALLRARGDVIVGYMWQGLPQESVRCGELLGQLVSGGCRRQGWAANTP